MSESERERETESRGREHVCGTDTVQLLLGGFPLGGS